MSDLKEASRRVEAAARDLGLDITIRQMDTQTRRAPEAAAAIGVEVGQIVKSLLFCGETSGMPYLLLVSGANRVDEAAVAEHLGEGLERPDAKYVRKVTGFAIGGIPPFGHTEPSQTLIDLDLLSQPTVWAAAGTPDTMFEISSQELATATQATPIGMTGG